MMRWSRKRSALFLLPLLAFLLVLVWPLPGVVRRPAGSGTVSVTDREGIPLYEVRETDAGSQQFSALADIAPTFAQALIAIEDRRFYAHSGVSVRGIARALWQNVRAGRIVSGGSTMTQQLVRIRLAPMRRTFLYKIKEALYAWKLERIRSKEEILEAYMNEAYFGHQAYGIGAAARTYFAITPRELSVAQSALLAGLVQSPGVLDPFINRDGAIRRQQLVLTAMRETGVLSEEQERAVSAEPMTLTSSRIPIRAPHFVMWLPQIRPEAFVSGATVRTTIDLSLQSSVERIVERNLAALQDLNVTSAAVVVLDARTGDLLSMVGSADYFDDAHDGAVNSAVAARQPGSALKPFTYALALTQGQTAATTVADIETQFFTQEGNPYIPRNYDYGYHGLVRFREALANSYNIAAVKVLEKVGVSTLLTFLKSAGITTLSQSPEYYGLALTLGDAEVTLLDLVRAYAIFPRGGKTVGVRVLAEDPILEGEQILDTRVAWLISDILSDSDARLPQFGADSPLNFSFPVAAKTGTTRNARDNWVIGFTPEILVGVWVGNADNAPMQGTSGVTGAGPIFHDVFEEAVRAFPPTDFLRPDGLSQHTICRLSGMLPSAACAQTIEEWFIDGTEPTEFDTFYQKISIDLRNGLLATDGCATEYKTDRTFTVFPPELKTWARENGWETSPVDASPLCQSLEHSSSVPSSSSFSVWLSIERPQAQDSYLLDPLIPDDAERVIFRARGSNEIRSVSWFVNGKKVGQGSAPDFRFDWQPNIGSFTVEARAEGVSDQRMMEVKR